MANSASLPGLTTAPAMDRECSDYNYSYGYNSDSSGLSDLSSPPDSPQPPSECYPSPPPTQDDKHDQTQRGRASSSQGEPAKKRRRVGPLPRSTQLLDLTNPETLPYADQLPQINLLTKTLRSHRKIVVIAGAGISTSAGIPDFRSADGLFRSVQKKHNLKASGKLLFDAAVYRDESLTASFHEMVRELSREAADSQPTAFHHMLARMAQDSRLSRLYTQNIDCIESSLPPLLTQVPLPPKAPWPRCIQLHGSLDKMVCQKCRHLAELDRDLFDGPEAPACPACTETDDLRTTTGQRSHGVGKMRPRIVLYNEHNPDEEAIAAVMNSDIRSRPDALIVVGTSLKIPGVRRLVKSLCKVVRGRRNGVTMWINNEPPVGKEFEDCWDLVVKGNCEEVARLAGLKKWDDNTMPVFDECDNIDVERVKREHSVSVVVHTPKAQRCVDFGIATPVSNNEESGSEQQTILPNEIASKGKKLREVITGSEPSKKKPAAKKSTAKRPTVNKTTRSKQKQSAPITMFAKVTKNTKTANGKQVKGKDDDSSHEPMKNLAANMKMFPNLKISKQSDPEAVTESITCQ